MPTHVAEPQVARIDPDMVELSLLVPGWQLTELERLAQNQGLTLGQVMRRLISAFLHEP
ncbi:MAG TPA: hypothetical protein VJ739_15320 [Gemmataceae bacterium]|nr:hypothetical protein [Gemmataceae bacterium]